MCLLVFVGVKYVNKSASVFLAVTIFAILSIFVGFFVSTGGASQNSVMCMYGDILMDRPQDGYCSKYEFDPATGGDDTSKPSALLKSLCGEHDTLTGAAYIADCFDQKPFLEDAPTWYRFGIPGLSHIKENWNMQSAYRTLNDAIDLPHLRTEKATESTNFVTCDNFKNFTTDAGIYQVGCGSNNDQWRYMESDERNDTISQLQDLGDSYPWSTKDKPYSYNDGYHPDSKKFDSFNWVAADLTSSLMIMIGIFFPSVTGIMAGSNRSGDLADAPTAIPKGTVAAIATTSTSYLLAVIFFGLCVDGALLQDKFGESLAEVKGGGGVLLTGLLCQWIHEKVMIIGAFLSTCGAGLQSLTGAPRLLQSIARDDLMPGMAWLAKGRGSGNEPTYAVLVTFAISFGAIMLANLDIVAPILTIFFLMCYLFVNVSTTICSLMAAPSWRPSFKYYHWSLSLVGAICCLTLIMLTSVGKAFAAFFIAGVIYGLITYFGAKKEWGDAIKGVSMSMALSSLRWYGNNISTHTKNWRPQILLLNKLNNETLIKYPQLILFADSLKEGKGLLIVKTIIEKNFENLMETDPDHTNEIHKMVNSFIKRENIQAIDTVPIVSENIANDMPIILQATGVSGLRANTYILNFPTVNPTRDDYSFFYKTMRHAQAAGCSAIVTKNIENFPQKSSDKIEGGTIDIWWIRLDGGMILLLAHLLMRRPTWKKNRLRIFVTAEKEDNSELMRSALITYLGQMRIKGEVTVVEVDASDVEPFPVSHKPASASASFQNKNDANVVMNNARKSMMVKNTQPKVDAIPDSHSGTWSGQPMKPRATVLKKMHEAGGLNKKLLEHSSNSELVLVNMPPIPEEHSTEKEQNYLRYIEAMTKGLKRIIMVRSTGNEVITMYN